MNHITFIRAGAGSGKTYHVTELIEQELRAKRLEPAGLVATSFTTKAAEELRQRLQARLYGAGLVTEAERMGEALLGTVHSIAAQLLERFAFEAGISPRLKVIAEEESARLLAQAVDAAAMDAGTEDKEDAGVEPVTNAVRGDYPVRRLSIVACTL